MRRTSPLTLLLTSALVSACSDDGTAGTDTLTTTSGATTGDATTGNHSTGEPTTGQPTTSSGTGDDSASTTSTSTTDPVSTTDATTTDATTTDATTTSTTDASTTDTTDTTDTTTDSTSTTDPGTSTDPGMRCGNDAIEGDEVCDGADLGGASCQSEGFDDGTLACLPDCSGFDTSACTLNLCGNGVRDDGEVCDGADLGGASCQSEGFDDGTLACLPDCSGFDTSACTLNLCGNGVRDDGEQCDGADLGGASCESQGLGLGQLACADTCVFDTSGCFSDGVLVTVRTSDGMLRALDPVDLSFTNIGYLGVGFDFGEVAWDATNGILWMIDGRPQESLYTVDLLTGAATLVGPHNIEDLFGLAHDPTTDTLYASGESPSGFYILNTMNGQPTFVGNPAIAADGLTYDSKRDQIIALEAGGSGRIYAIDRMTGAPTVFAAPGWINNNGLAYDPIHDVYWAIDWSGDLYQYDPNNGYARTKMLSNIGAHDGLTFVPGFQP